MNVAREKRDGMHGDGGGRSLQVTKPGAKLWKLRDPATSGNPASDRPKGRTLEKDLGYFAIVSLAETRA